MPSLTIGKKRLENLKKMPLVETTVRKSKDGNYIVNKTTFTTIKPIQYYETVLSSEPSEINDEEVMQESVDVQEEKVEV